MRVITRHLSAQEDATQICWNRDDEHLWFGNADEDFEKPTIREMTLTELVTELVAEMGEEEAFTTLMNLGGKY